MSAATKRRVWTIIALVVLAIFFSPIVLGYFVSLNGAQWWLWLWLALFAWFVNSKCSLETRGIAFLVLSVFIAVTGKSLLLRSHSPPSADITDMVMQVMLLIGGSVGGNFLSQALLNRRGGSSVPK